MIMDMRKPMPGKNGSGGISLAAMSAGLSSHISNLMVLPYNRRLQECEHREY